MVLQLLAKVESYPKGDVICVFNTDRKQGWQSCEFGRLSMSTSELDVEF